MFLVAAICLSSSSAPGIARTQIGFNIPAKNIVMMFSNLASLFFTSLRALLKKSLSIILYAKFPGFFIPLYSLTPSLITLFSDFCIILAVSSHKFADPLKFTLLAGLLLYSQFCLLTLGLCSYWPAPFLVLPLELVYRREEL